MLRKLSDLVCGFFFFSINPVAQGLPTEEYQSMGLTSTIKHKQLPFFLCSKGRCKSTKNSGACTNLLVSPLKKRETYKVKY